MRILLMILFSAYLFFSSHLAMAQCTPDPNCTDPEGDGEICPTEYPNAVENTYYDQTTTIICPTTVHGQNIHHVRLVDVVNIPQGMSYQCQDGECDFYPGIARCANVYGTPEPGSWGYYNIKVTLEVFVNLFGNPVSVGEFTDSSAVVFVEPYLHSDFNLPLGVNNNLCYGVDYEITYTGNAQPSANYYWNFSNATVVSGEGAGPYTIRYPQTSTVSRDSISLYVEQDGFVSPVSIQRFTVEDCLSLPEHNQSTVSIQPNPCHEQLYIEHEGSRAFIQVYALSGALVMQTLLKAQNITFDVSHLPRGMYFVKIENAKGSIVQKIIKE